MILTSPRDKLNTEKVSIFLSPDHLEEIRKEAEQKGTTVSGMIRMIILEHLNKKDTQK